MSVDFKWLENYEFPIITNEDNAKYENFNSYVENNLDSLINHKLGDISKEELSEYVLDLYQFCNEAKINHHIEKLYDYIFRFINLPQIQNYLLKVDIEIQLSYIENYLLNEDTLNFIKEQSKYYINHFNILYKYNYSIKESKNISTADILINTYKDEIIKKYAVDENILN